MHAVKNDTQVYYSYPVEYTCNITKTLLSGAPRTKIGWETPLHCSTWEQKIRTKDVQSW